MSESRIESETCIDGSGYKYQFDLEIQKIVMDVPFKCFMYIAWRRSPTRMIETKSLLSLSGTEKEVLVNQKLSNIATCFVDSESNQFKPKPSTITLMLSFNGVLRNSGYVNLDLCSIINPKDLKSKNSRSFEQLLIKSAVPNSKIIFRLTTTFIKDVKTIDDVSVSSMAGPSNRLSQTAQNGFRFTQNLHESRQLLTKKDNNKDSSSIRDQLSIASSQGTTKIQHNSSIRRQDSTKKPFMGATIYNLSNSKSTISKTGIPDSPYVRSRISIAGGDKLDQLDSQKVINQLQNRISKLQSQINRLNLYNCQQGKRLSIYVSENSQLKAQLAYLSQEKVVNEQINARLNQRKTLYQKNAAQEIQIKDLAKKLEQSAKTNSTLMSQINTLTSSNSSLRSSQQALKVKLQTKDVELSQMSHKISVQFEKNKKQSEFLSTNSSHRITNLENQLHQFKTINQALTKECDFLKNMCKQYQTNMMNNKNQFENDSANLLKQIYNLKKQKQNLQIAIVKCEKQAKQAVKNAQQVEKRLMLTEEKLNTKQLTLIQEHNKRQRQLQQQKTVQLTTIRQEYHTRQDQLKHKHTQHIHELNARIESLERDKSTLTITNAQLRTKNQENTYKYQHAVNEIKEHNKSLLSHNSQLIKENQDIKVEIYQCKSVVQNNISLVNATKHSQQLLKSQNQLRKSQQDYRKLAQTYSLLSKDFEKLKMDYINLQAKHTKQQQIFLKKSGEAESKMIELQKRLTISQTAGNQQLMRKNINMEMELKYRDQKIKEFQSLLHQFQNVQWQLGLQKNNLTQLEKQNQSISTQLAQKSRALAIQTQKNVIAETQRQQLLKKINVLQMELNNNKTQNNFIQVNNLNSQMKTLQNKIKQYQTVLSAKEAQYQNEYIRFQEAYNQKHSECENLSNEMNHLIVQNQKLANKINQNQNLLINELRSQKEALQMKIEVMMSEMLSLKRRFEDQKQKITQPSKAAEQHKIKLLENQLDKKDRIARKLTKQKLDLEAEVVQLNKRFLRQLSTITRT